MGSCSCIDAPSCLGSCEKHLTSWYLPNITSDNSDNCVLYLSGQIIGNTTERTISLDIFKSSPPANSSEIVASGTATYIIGDEPKIVQIIAENSSGLDGNVTWDGIIFGQSGSGGTELENTTFDFVLTCGGQESEVYCLDIFCEASTLIWSGSNNVLSPEGIYVKTGGCSNDAATPTLEIIKDEDFHGLSASYALLADVSLSISETDLDLLKAWAISFVGRLKDSDKACLYKFAGTYSRLIDYTSDKNALIAAINTLSRASATKMYDCIIDAIQYTSVTISSTLSRSLIVITDGRNNTGSHSLDDVIDEAISNNIRIYTIGIGDADTPSLQEMTNETGGEFFYTENMDGIDDTLGSLVSSISPAFRVKTTAEGASYDLEDLNCAACGSCSSVHLNKWDTKFGRVDSDPSGYYRVSALSSNVYISDSCKKDLNAVSTMLYPCISSTTTTTTLSDNSSSSSSSSSSSIDSSSSSSFEEFEIMNLDINQNHDNLIPFTWIGEVGTSSDLGKNAQIGFTIETSDSPYMDYEAVVNRDNSAIASSPQFSQNAVTDVYVQQDKEAYYKHISSFYVDIIAKDASGLREVRTHVEPNKYEFEEIDNGFIIPKFSWSTSSNTSTESFTAWGNLDAQQDVDNGPVGSFWMALNDGTLNKISYNTNVSSVTYSSNSINSSITSIIAANDNNKLYVSADDELYIYAADHYFTPIGETAVPDEFVEYYKESNDSNIIVLYNNAAVWSVQPENGKVSKLNHQNLTLLKEYSGFDGPVKVVRSEFHNAYIVSGSYILWKIDTNDVVTPIYEINDYKIIDFDVSENGQICIVFKGPSNYVVRILDNNFYSIVMEEIIEDFEAKFCKYCDKDRFSVLVEKSTTDTTYFSSNYLFDLSSKSLEKIKFTQEIEVTTTTTTLGFAVKPIEIQNFYGGETLQSGQNYEIKWISSESISDSISIKLFKDGLFYKTITSETKNSGVYLWNVGLDIEEGSDYMLRMEWLAQTKDQNNISDSGSFTISKSASATTTTTTTVMAMDTAIGMDYDEDNNYLIVVLKNGLFSILDLTTKEVYGLFKTGLELPVSFVVKNDVIAKFDAQTKVRIFVGSEPYLSDKWDSGEIETNLTKMYYGGGNDLEAGKEYYVNIQTYSNRYGWSKLQSKTFVMPK